MMTPEQAEQWAQALESNDYEQTDGFLGYNEDDTKYRCCLGVCVEKFDSENVNMFYILGNNLFFHGTSNGQNPSLDFQEKYLGVDETRMFARLNDGYKISFENIAKVVRHLYIYDRKEV